MHPLLDLAARPVVGHRGNSAFAPENTLESFRQAVVSGADAIELDVRLTRDGHAVVMHDTALDRTTDGRGLVAATSLGELRTADAGARFTTDGGASFPWRGRDLRVPLLAEVLEQFPDTPLLIEVKVAEAAAPVRDLIIKHGAHKRCAVVSFLTRAMPALRSSGIATGSTRRDTAWLLAHALLRLPPRSVPFEFMCVPLAYRRIPVPVSGYVRALAPLGVPVHMWTVNEPDVARRLWRLGVRGIITNDPAAILKMRRSQYPDR